MYKTRDLHALPQDAYERSVAERPLLQFLQGLGKLPALNADEQEFMTTMLKTWEEGRLEALAEGRIEGRTEGIVENILVVLEARGVTVPATARKRILAQKDPKRLADWLKKAAVATSANELFKDRS
jgi:hypothetical protein